MTDKLRPLMALYYIVLIIKVLAELWAMFKRWERNRYQTT